MKQLLLILLLFIGPLVFAQKPVEVLPADATPARYMPLLQNRRVAVVANQTSAVGDSSLVDMLLARRVNVVRVMAPEHGFRGKEDAGASVGNSVDSVTGLPVVSLYGAHNKPRPEDLADVDVVVYDLQDVGVRFYTYISTLQYVMEACADNDKRLVILDKPNPNGFYVDGPVLEAENRSFVGMQPIPVVYGMTAGEYAMMLRGEKWLSTAKKVDLEVLPCLHYTHKTRYKLPVAPSPNLRTMAAIYAYPSLCFFEGTPLSVGRGTDLPFLHYGCPEFAGRFSYSFTPQSPAGAKHPPHEGKVCYGELVGTTPDEVLAAINNHLHLEWLLKAYNAFPDKDRFFNSFFVKLAGTSRLQEQIKSGLTAKQIRDSWQKDLDAFKKIRKKYLLYPDF